MERWTIADAKVITPDEVFESGYVTIEGGCIVSSGAGAPSEPGRVVSAKGATVTPGLIDIHVHGTGGHWGFFDTEDLLSMSREIAKFGVTAFVPATVSLPHKQVIASIKLMRGAMAKQAAAEVPDGAAILGINIEGPYINKKRPGAHNPMCIRDPKEDEIAEVLDAAGDALKIFTLAPEIPGGMELTKRLSEMGVVVSIGHSDADRGQTLEAVRNGARLVTHLYNALRSFHQREPGNAFAALVEPGLYCELIADGKHVHPDIVKMTARVKPETALVLITDAFNAAGMKPGKYNVWGFEIEVADGMARMADGTIAGSVLTLNRGVANMSRFAELPLEKCVRMATATPAELLRLPGGAGTLSPGSRADVSVFDDGMNCLATIVAGNLVYKAEEFNI